MCEDGPGPIPIDVGAFVGARRDVGPGPERELPVNRLDPTDRTRLRRKPERGAYDRATIDAILDEGFVCHLAVAAGGHPRTIPTVYGRDGDRVYVHGSAGNRVLRAIRDGAEVCLCVTLVDGLVLARSAFHTSVNYRSVILYGRGQEVTDPEEKMQAMHTILEHVVPGRWEEVREPSREELLQTLVVAFGIVEASAKVRIGPPVEEDEDYALDCWAGVVPLALASGAPVDDPRLAPGISPATHVTRYTRTPDAGRSV